MNVSTWSIKNPIPVIMLYILLCFLGFSAFHRMKIQSFPDIDLPMVIVSASLPGATPEQLESDVARKIEDAVASIQGIKHIYTNIQDGNVQLTAEFRFEKPIQEAVDDVRSAVSRVRSDLPADLRDPVINRMELASQPLLAYTISSPNMDDEALSWFVDNTVSRRLLAVRGVGAVSRVGGDSREISVALDALQIQALGTTATDISQSLRQVQTEGTGGRVDIGDAEQPMRTLATVGSAKEIKEMLLPLSDGRSVRLSDVATVTDTLAERRSIAFLNGKPVVGFEISRSRGESDVAVGVGVREALDQLLAENPGLEINEAFDFVTPTEEEYSGSMMMLYEGAFLAMLVVWLFLREWRATLISALALPLSVIPAFFGMYLLGFTVNTVTLIALSLVVGILVDDAIVEVENIVRHLRMGKKPLEAAMEAATEIGLAVVATTFTLIAVFLPTSFMDGIVGQFFRQFGWTAAIAVFMSLVVARMLTPMMAAYLLKPMDVAEHRLRWLDNYYMLYVGWCLKHRLFTLIGAAGFFIFSVMMIPLLPQGFMPADDNSQTQVRLSLPPGSTLAQSTELAEQARLLLKTKMDGVQKVYTTVGGGNAGGNAFDGAGEGGVNQATLTVLLPDRGKRSAKQKLEIQMRELLTALPGVRVRVGLGGGGSDEQYTLALTGENTDALQAAALAVERDLRQISGLGNIVSTASLVRPEIAVKPDFARAADLGVTSSAIGDTLRIATQGDYDMNLSKLNLMQRQVPIMVRLNEAARQDLSVMERLTVPGTHGPVMLGEIATLKVAGGPAVISRFDRSRNINLNIELAGVAMGDMANLIAQLPSVQNLPSDIKIADTGESEMLSELFGGFATAMLAGVLCIYIVLVLLFKDFMQPITILAALPLSLGGVFMGLLMAGMSLSMPSLLGLIMLMGIATKNSILLVDYAIIARRDYGMQRLEAVLDACHKRARPIIMTTVAMGAGMMPIALGIGSTDTSFRSPMAVAVIGGLITSTILSLFVIPVVFTYIDDVEHWVKRVIFRQSPKVSD